MRTNIQVAIISSCLYSGFQIMNWTLISPWNIPSIHNLKYPPIYEDSSTSPPFVIMADYKLSLYEPSL